MDGRFLFVPLIFCCSSLALSQYGAPPRQAPDRTDTQTISASSRSFLAASAQSGPENQAPANQPYTIQANSRVVLTDVTVTDSKGNPVHGLSESAFRIFDNNKPQTIATFEEHAGTPPVKLMPAMSPAGIYSNDYLLQLPPVLNVVIIDIANLEITEQMYLYFELTKFFKEQPDGQPLAIYLRAGNGCFLVQNFTSDRALQLAALHKAIPRIPPTGRESLFFANKLALMGLRPGLSSA
jgi:hypothetical protein